MSRVLFSIGPFHVQVFGLMIALGALAAFLVVSREAKRTAAVKGQVMDLVLYLLVGGILGARLFYVLVYNWSFFAAEPWRILMINQGGLSIHGGILGGLLAGFLFVKSRKLNFWSTADLVAPGLILGQALGRVGCDVFGKAMTGDWPWGIVVNGARLHPAQMYEFILDFALFAFLWSYRQKTRFQGQLFLMYAISFALIRAVVEFFRINPVVWGPFTVAHASSLLFIIIAGILWWHLSRQGEKVPQHAGPLKAGITPWLASGVLTAISIALYYSFN